MADPKVWLIGENNPYQASPERAQRFAMYPDPLESAGGRFCFLVLGMEEADYLRSFQRRDLCHPKWSAPQARASAACLIWEMAEVDRVILLGGKVWGTFFPEVPYQPFAVAGRFLSLPHPSARNAAVWGNYLSWSTCRAAVAQHAPHLAPLLGRSELTRGRTAAEREVARVG